MNIEVISSSILHTIKKIIMAVRDYERERENKFVNIPKDKRMLLSWYQSVLLPRYLLSEILFFFIT